MKREAMKRNDRTRNTRRRARRRFAALAAAVAVAVGAASTSIRDARAAEPQRSGAAPPAPTAAPAPTPAAAAARTARGEFDVKVAPLAEDAKAGIALGRMSLDKTFRGALVATSTGEMLTVTSPNASSGAYAATERVTGTLDGRRGSFALVHVGTMTSAGYQLSISVVPDSGTEELAGLAGTLAIDIRDGKHYYVLEYTLPVQ